MTAGSNLVYSPGLVPREVQFKSLLPSVHQTEKQVLMKLFLLLFLYDAVHCMINEAQSQSITNHLWGPNCFLPSDPIAHTHISGEKRDH